MVALADILLSKCSQFRSESQFIDVRLKVGEDIFPAHRVVLAASSDYFYAMFTNGMKESNQEMIELKDENITSNAVKIILDSIYTEDLHVTEENVFEVLAAAFHLQVTSVVQQCCDFLKKEFVQLRFDLQNYCLLCTVAHRYGMKDLQEAAESKMALKFKDTCENEEFLSIIEPDQFLSLLSRDDLSAPSETFIFKSVMQWIKHKKEERMAVAAKVIGAVRLGLVDIDVVIDDLNTKQMRQIPEIYAQVYEAVIYKHRPSHKPPTATKQIRPRSKSPVSEDENETFKNVRPKRLQWRFFFTYNVSKTRVIKFEISSLCCSPSTLTVLVRYGYFVVIILITLRLYFMFLLLFPLRLEYSTLTSKPRLGNCCQELHRQLRPLIVTVHHLSAIT